MKEINYKIKSLNHIYQGTIKTPALNNVSMEINKGDIICFAGPSGSGKTTLLNCIAGMINPTSGQILYKDQDLLDFTEEELASYRNQSIGIMFQDFGLIDYLTVSENISVPMNFAKKDNGNITTRIKELLQIVGLEGVEKKLPNQLSGGQKQRIGLAVAMANDPEVLIADEPTGNLDAETASEIMNFIIETSKNSEKTFLFSSHDPAMIDRADKIIRLKSGHIENRNG